LKPYTLFICLVLLLSCSHQAREQEFFGEAQGTTYHIKLYSQNNINYNTAIDSILRDIDQSLSLYLESSTINKVNHKDTIVATDPYFHQVFHQSKEVYQATQGAFDPTVLPLVQGWGFGKNKSPTIDSSMVDSLLMLVNFKGVTMGIDHQLQLHHVLKRHCDSAQIEINYLLHKSDPNIQLDFNAIAQGFTVDIISDYLLNSGVDNYMIELGGEVKARGGKPNNTPWKIGIDKPLENQEKRELHVIVPLLDKAMATSGNYRQFYFKDGVKYAHTIDPKTGYPVIHSLLSATVLADECSLADAYATAFMVMGVEKSKAFLRENPQLGLDVFFTYSDNYGDWKTFTTKGMQDLIQEVN